MTDGTLSQDEIDALLGEDAEELSLAEPRGGRTLQDRFSEEERKTLQTIFDAVREAQSKVLSSIVGQTVTLGVPTITLATRHTLLNSFEGEIVEIKIDYLGPTGGGHRYLFQKEEALKIANALMGQENDELDATLIPVLGEAVSQLTGAGSTVVNSRFKKELQPVAPEGDLVPPGELSLFADEVIRVDYPMTASELGRMGLTELLEVKVAQGLIALPNPPPQVVKEPAGEAQLQGASEAAQTVVPSAVSTPEVRGIALPSLGAEGGPSARENIGILMDVSMELTVELGRTKWQIRDILGMGEGTVIELDKLAGEPVDVLVNRNPIAKGEVVVIDENFGVRVTEILSPLSRDERLE